MRLGHLLSMALIVALAVLAGMLAARFSLRADWTYGNRNTLTAASERVLAALDQGPIQLTAYIDPGPDRANIRTRLARYVTAADNVSLVFTDPARHPHAVRRLGVGAQGAVVITYQGRRQTVTDYDEPSVTHALQRLSSAHTRHIVFIAGHGERTPAGRDSAGYRQLARALADQGLAARTVNLARAGAVPRHTDILAIASPQQQLLPGEVAMIRRYVADGGNLLWADDPGPRYGLAPLARNLGVRWLSGTLIFPDYQKLGAANAAMTLVAQYPDTAITRHLARLTLFPYSGGLGTRANGGDGWKHETFLRSSPRSWLETRALNDGPIIFEPRAGDRAGPVTMGLALARPAPGPPGSTQSSRRQRAAVIADSAFMDNGHVATLGNRTLALALFQWLAHRDAQIAVDVPKAPDSRLQMAPDRVRDAGWLCVAALPLAWLVIGFGHWWRRRRR